MAVSVHDVRQLFSGMDFNDEEKHYLAYHTDRLVYSVNMVQRYCDVHGTRKILDIGPHLFTYCCKYLIKPTPEITTLGFANERLFPSKLAERHIQLDLNTCDSFDVKEFAHQFDLITFLETIEHLYTSPTIVLRFFKELLRSSAGAGVFIGTPNAVHFTKRVNSFLGRNPYELISTDRTNPGHFREYTMQELLQYAHEADLSIWHAAYCSYWPVKNRLLRLVNMVPPLRSGLVVVMKTAG